MTSPLACLREISSTASIAMDMVKTDRTSASLMCSVIYLLPMECPLFRRFYCHGQSVRFFGGVLAFANATYKSLLQAINPLLLGSIHQLEAKLGFARRPFANTHRHLPA